MSISHDVVESSIAEDIQSSLVVPDTDGLSLQDAALVYAEAGWFVLPIRPGSKNPGSVVGSDWQRKSSRDAAVVRRWWAEDTNYGIALHVGRSGAIAFDLDRASLDELPLDLAAALRTGLCQHSRRGQPDRGHYLFLNDKGFGNGAGAFRPFGEVRGKNGVIIAAPTPHVEVDGEYKWATAGRLEELPPALRECLSVAPELDVESLTAQAFDQFLLDNEEERQPGRLDGPANLYRRNVRDGMARHDALLHCLCMAYRESRTGAYSAREATERLRNEFEASLRAGSSAENELKRPSRPFDPREFQHTAEWAAAAALTSNPDEVRERMDRDKSVDEEAFWSARPDLDHLLQFARARMVAPWAMLGAVLARALTSVPPTVVLPNIVGSYGSLNSFFALVGASGAGKGSAERAAADFLYLARDVAVHPVGSGEGLVKVFAHRPKVGEEQCNLENAVLFSAPEVDSIATQNSRSGATLLPQLRSSWSGEQLGFSYADPTKALRLHPHRYRLCLVVGVQPERAEPLLDDADGGTPQRFIWLPTTDPHAPDEPTDEPPPLVLAGWPANAHGQQGDNRRLGEIGLMNIPVTKDDLEVIAIPSGVAEAIRQQRKTVLRGDASANPLDGHAMQARLKVAGALMVLNGRSDHISYEDWELAGVVMDVSDRTRRVIRDALTAKASAWHLARGRADAQRTQAADEEIARANHQKTQRVSDNLLKHLRNGDGSESRSAVKKRIAKRDRHLFDGALASLVEDGLVRLEKFEHNSQPGTRVVLVEGGA